MFWKGGLKWIRPALGSVFAVLVVSLSALASHSAFELQATPRCKPQLQSLLAKSVVIMPVPSALATRADDRLFMPDTENVYLDVRFQAPTYRLLETAARYLPHVSSVLVVGTGASPELLMMARKFPHLKALHGVDIDPKALAASEDAIKLNADGDRRIKVWRSDGLDKVNQTYDLILFAAPRPMFMDSLRVRFGDLAAARIWSMMNRRKDLFDMEGRLRDRVLGQMDRVLSPGGRFLLMSDAAEEPQVSEEFDSLKHGLWLWGSERDGFFTIYDFFRSK